MTRNGVAQLEVCMLAFFVSHEALKRVGKRSLRLQNLHIQLSNSYLTFTCNSMCIRCLL